MAGREGSAEEREWIQALYRQAAESRDQAVACQAQAMLFGRAMEEGDFAQAEALLDRLPPSPCTTGPRWRPAWPRPRGMGTGRDSCWSTSCSNRPAGPRPPCWPCWSWPAGRAAGGSGPSGGQGRGPGPAAGARPLRRLVGPPPAGLSDPGHGRGHGGAGGAAGVFGDPLARGTSPSAATCPGRTGRCWGPGCGRASSGSSPTLTTPPMPSSGPIPGFGTWWGRPPPPLKKPPPPGTQAGAAALRNSRRCRGSAARWRPPACRWWPRWWAGGRSWPGSPAVCSP